MSKNLSITKNLNTNFVNNRLKHKVIDKIDKVIDKKIPNYNLKIKRKKPLFNIKTALITSFKYKKIN